MSRNPANQDAASALRRRLNLSPSTLLVLFAGKFTAAKGPCELLAAFLQLSPLNASLLFVGDGAEKERLQAMARGASDRVHFMPFTNQSEMPAVYLASDLFVLPSEGFYETWGLAVNEAMHMGVPALVSDRVGCQMDLVTDQETGWVYRAGENELPAKLKESLDTLLKPGAKERLRQAVLGRISGYTYARASQGLLEALQAEPVVPGP